MEKLLQELITTFLPNGENDFIKYVDWVNAKSWVLNNIDIPTLIIFGDDDECVLTQPIEIIKWYLMNNLSRCNIQIIKGADHLYKNRYEDLVNIIKNNA